MNIRAVAVGYGGAHFYIAATDAAHTGEQVVAGFALGQAGFVFLIRGFVVGVQRGWQERDRRLRQGHRHGL